MVLTLWSSSSSAATVCPRCWRLSVCLLECLGLPFGSLFDPPELLEEPVEVQLGLWLLALSWSTHGAHSVSWLWRLFFGVVKALRHPTWKFAGLQPSWVTCSCRTPVVAGAPACVLSDLPPGTQSVSVVSGCRPYLLCFLVFPWKNSKLSLRLLKSKGTECNLDSFAFNDLKKLACSLSISAFLGELAFLV